MLTSRALNAQLIFAACEVADGDFEPARQQLGEWKEKVKWDRRPHHRGYWGTRCARLDECIRAGKPYRDEPEK